MKKYQPSHKMNRAGVAWLLGSSLGGGLAIGTIAQFISLFIYLIILFPIGMGLIGGGVMTLAIRQGKVRNPWVAAFFGALTGLSICGAMQGIGYLQFKQGAAAEIQQEFGQVSAQQTDQIIDAYLQGETGATGLLGYVRHSAQQGVEIIPRSGQGLNLGEVGTWIYWLVELAVVGGMVVAIAYSSASDPYCETCNEWYGKEKRLGGVNARTAEQFLTLLKTEQFSAAGACVDPIHGLFSPSLEALLHCCPTCSESSDVLTVNALSLNEKGKLVRDAKLKGLLSPEQSQLFQVEIDKKLADATEAAITSAQWERSQPGADHRFTQHELNSEEAEVLVEQIAQYPQIKAAYLVRKETEYFPEQPFYILGITRRPGFVESEVAESNFVKKLMTELELPEQTLVTCLNKQKSLSQAIQTVAETAIYQKS